MKIATIELERMLQEILESTEMDESNILIVKDVYLAQTKRGLGHHDINDIVWRIFRLKLGELKVNPVFRKIASFGCMESWDGDKGAGELTCTFAMKKAMELAGQHGMGLCTMRNSSHYMASAPYTMLAAKSGYIGIIIAKDPPSMGMPGYEGKIVGHSPNGYAFPTNEEWPVMLDACLAYVSGHGNLNRAVETGQQVPAWWGVDKEGKPTTDPAELLAGTRYAIGEHKGYGYAILCEMLTGVLGKGLILDQTEGPDGLTNNTSHTAFAIKADGLMPMEEFKDRTSELVERLMERAPGVRIPGYRSYKSELIYEQTGEIEVSDNFILVHDYLVSNKGQLENGSITELMKAAGIKIPGSFLTAGKDIPGK